MTKLYYTCPIQAAYMAKEFGVITVDKEGTVYTTAGCYLLPWDNGSLAEGPFCIIDDCSPIFEPQVGDLIDGLARIGYVQEVGIDEVYYDVHGGDWATTADKAIILQRNDKPFFWPLTESV